MSNSQITIPRQRRFLPIALIQLECHPFITIGEWDPTSEPFVADPPVLASVAKAGFDVRTLEASCRKLYIDWHRTRVFATLDWLKDRIPAVCRHSADTTLPPVVVFPEGSIPVEFLDHIC